MIPVTLVVSAVLVYLMAIREPTVESRITLVVTTNREDSGDRTELQSLLAERYARLADSTSVRQVAAGQTGLSVEQLVANVTVAAAETPGLIEVAASGPASQNPASQAEAFADALSEAVTSAQAQERQRDLADLNDRLRAVTRELALLPAPTATPDPDTEATQRQLTAQTDALVEAIAGRSETEPDALERLGDAVAGEPSRDLPRLVLVVLLVTGLIVSELTVYVLKLRRGLTPGSETAQVQQLTGAAVVIPVRSASEVLEAEAARIYLAAVKAYEGPSPPGLTFVPVDPVGDVAGLARAVARAAVELGRRARLVEDRYDRGVAPELAGAPATSWEATSPGETTPDMHGRGTRTSADYSGDNPHSSPGHRAPGAGDLSPTDYPLLRGTRDLRRAPEAVPPAPARRVDSPEQDSGEALHGGRRFDGLLVASTPPLPTAVLTPLRLAGEVGGVVLVVDPARVKAQGLEEATALLVQAGVGPLAVVLAGPAWLGRGFYRRRDR